MINQAISVTVASSLLNCIPSFFSAPLSLKISDNSHHSFSEALKKSGRYDVKIIKDTHPISSITRKRRTPSPIREAERSVKEMKEWWFQQNNDEEPENIIPHALIDESLISSTSKYVQFENNDCSMEKVAKYSTEVSYAIENKLAPFFVESCLKFDFSFLFVTQFEVYYRNEENIDSSATHTLNDPYYDMPVGVIRDKNEKGKAWFEVSVFYKRYEILITGGMLGEMGSNQLNPFLGPSVPFSNLTSKKRRSTTNIIIPYKKQDSLLRERNLRNWTKPSASFKWA
ncbi:hypothetical protein CU098_012995, partial [Rhizopus stolonifer]